MRGWRKHPTPGVAFHDAFYKFVHLPATVEVASALRDITAPLLGSILVAHEGINGMLAGSAEALDAFRHTLATDPAVWRALCRHGLQAQPLHHAAVQADEGA